MICFISHLCWYVYPEETATLGEDRRISKEKLWVAGSNLIFTLLREILVIGFSSLTNYLNIYPLLIIENMPTIYKLTIFLFFYLTIIYHSFFRNYAKV